MKDNKSSRMYASARRLAFRNISELHLEVAQQCNLECRYCYAARSEQSGPSLMPLSAAIRCVEEIFSSTASKTLRLVFHGGEPLLQSSNWLRNVLAYSLRLARSLEKHILFEMQSNLTLLNDEKLQLIREYKVLVGTSLDGPPDVNDYSRGYGDLVVRNIAQLQRVGCFGGVICVIGKHNCNMMYDVMRFFDHLRLYNVGSLIGYSVGRGAYLTPLTSLELFIAIRISNAI